MLNKSKAIAALMTATLFVAPASVFASEITLTFENHEFALQGQFAGFEDAGYVIISNGQSIHVPAAMVRCDGDDCFDAAEIAALNS
jgi:hypothetical protein